MAIWKQISFESGYSISEYGDVRNDKTGLILKQWTLKNGYRQIQIRKNVYTIHRLTAKVFHSLSETVGGLVMHLDDDKTNNHYLNLKWGTQSENIKTAYAKGRHSRKGERHHLTKFKQTDIDKIRERILNGERVCALSREYNVCHQTISSIKNLKNWK